MPDLQSSSALPYARMAAAPRKWSRENAIALNRELGGMLLNMCSQAEAAEILMAHMRGGNPDKPPSKSWAEAVVSAFSKETHHPRVYSSVDAPRDASDF
ncbi:hypothetical protein ACVWYH_006535 [Bradyrhizobium sp. GM24.11]